MRALKELVLTTQPGSSSSLLQRGDAMRRSATSGKIIEYSEQRERIKVDSASLGDSALIQNYFLGCQSESECESLHAPPSGYWRLTFARPQIREAKKFPRMTLMTCPKLDIFGHSTLPGTFPSPNSTFIPQVLSPGTLGSSRPSGSSQVASSAQMLSQSATFASLRPTPPPLPAPPHSGTPCTWLH